MTYPPHIFADNPINRDETERRAEDGILQQVEYPASRFLPLRNLNGETTQRTIILAPPPRRQSHLSATPQP